MSAALLMSKALRRIDLRYGLETRCYHISRVWLRPVCALPNRKALAMIRLPGSSIVLLAALSLSACGDESGANQDQPNASSPAGTNQQAVVNSLGTPDSPEMMPSTGAPGTGGNGTQPDTSVATGKRKTESGAPQ